MYKNQLFYRYFAEWMHLYKNGAIRPITFNKYKTSLQSLKKIAPKVKLADLNRQIYQKILNEYAKTHEKRTTMDFHRQLRSSIQDALDEGLISRDPTRKAVVKGTIRRNHKIKFLSQAELVKLLAQLDLAGQLSWDHFILLIAKTGLRFSEALGLTPADFDFRLGTITINKTWDYKATIGSFAETKNESSKRKITLDKQCKAIFKPLVKKLEPDKPIFIQNDERVFNRTINKILEVHCKKADVPVISIHGLRHTHASTLLYAGVSVASVARRLGHSNISTTQGTYLHIIKELEDKDNNKILKYLSELT